MTFVFGPPVKLPATVIAALADDCPELLMTNVLLPVPVTPAPPMVNELLPLLEVRVKVLLPLPPVTVNEVLPAPLPMVNELLPPLAPIVKELLPLEPAVAIEPIVNALPPLHAPIVK